MIVKFKDIKRERANAHETLANIDAYIDVCLGNIDDATRAFLIEDAEGAFNLYFACAKAQGLPIGSTTPRRAAEHYIIGCVNKPRETDIVDRVDVAHDYDLV